jgi:hypothetical protein
VTSSVSANPGNRCANRRFPSCSSGVEHREAEGNDGRYPRRLHSPLVAEGNVSATRHCTSVTGGTDDTQIERIIGTSAPSERSHR